MSQSHARNYIHLIFSTKHRHPFIRNSIADGLYEYIGGTLMGIGCNPIKVGGHLDHVHALFMLNKTVALSKAIEEVKSHSSTWMKGQGEGYKNFYWQGGYGAFSVNPAELDTVVAYIEGQAVHHQRRTFQQELLVFLKKYGVEYDERYLWD